MILDTVRQTIKRYSLLKKGEKVIAAVSGGPDSLALLVCLHELSVEFSLEVYVAHFDHMLRPGSCSESGFVRATASDLGLRFYSGRADVRSLRGNKGSLEEAARDARMKFLLKLSSRLKAGKIALGHNLDDQAETVLMRIIRGAGLSGLSGMLVGRELNGGVFIRPLLHVSRQRIEKFLRGRKIRPFRDPSNESEVFLRNKLRRKLIPMLEKEYNPGIKQVLCSLAENSACDYDYIISQARRVTRAGQGGYRLERLLAMHPSLRRMLIRLQIERLQGSTRRITARHMEEIEDMIFNRPEGSIVDLPKGIFAQKKGACLYLRRGRAR